MDIYGMRKILSLQNLKSLIIMISKNYYILVGK